MSPAATSGAAVRPRLKERYLNDVVPALKSELELGNVMLVHKGKKVRVGYQIQDDGTKVRIARPSGEVIK